MKIKTKMLAGSVLLAVIPVLIASLTISYQAYQESYAAIQAGAQEKLIAIRDGTRRHIEDQFSRYRQQVMTSSSNGMIVEAMAAFKPAFNRYVEEVEADTDSQFSAVSRYYENTFQNEYQAQNNGSSINVGGLYEQQRPATTALQHAYIMDNAHPLGSKHLLTDSGDGSEYAQLHRRYHPPIRQYLQQFDYYDIFLVDIDSGDVVYSVYKELDFATSLKTGPYRNSGLAKAFSKAAASNDRDFVYLEDFAPYTPSYEAPAAFIASPIFSGDEKIGVLVFQMPIDQINNIMTHDQHWQGSGLGESGETYLVGSDRKMRSLSRFLIEDPEAYYQALEKDGVDPDILGQIRSKSTSVGLQPVKSEGSSEAIAGKSGFDVFPDYRDVRVLSAYAPLEIKDVSWAIMSEIDEEEAYRAITELQGTILVLTSVVVAVVVVIATVIGLLFSNALVKPILSLSNTLQGIDRETDLRPRVEVNSDDETGMAGKALNSMMDNFSNIIESLSTAVDQVASSSQETARATEESNKNVATGKDELNMLATAMTEMTATTQEISSHTSQAALFANETKDATANCQKVMDKSVDSLQSLADSINQSADVIHQLEENSNNITQVLDVIRSVAEQTNLLALNAAIEAARAGEQGRGFAVVADEVRTLAQRTQESTEEIQGLIERFQTGATKAVSAMNQSREDVNSTVELSNETHASLQQIVDTSYKISDVTITVASATEQQSAASAEIQENASRINDMFDRTAVAMTETSASSHELERIAQELKVLAAKFTT